MASQEGGRSETDRESTGDDGLVVLGRDLTILKEGISISGDEEGDWEN